jgi:hypothetical protein
VYVQIAEQCGLKRVAFNLFSGGLDGWRSGPMGIGYHVRITTSGQDSYSDKWYDEEFVHGFLVAYKINGTHYV